MLRRGCSGAVAAVLLVAAAAAAAVPGAAGFHLGGDESGLVRGMLAAIREQAEAEDAARFAVAEHNKNQGAALEFARVVQAKRQVVAGTLHDLMLEVVDAGKKSLYSAKVWVKPWQDFKAVVEFRHVGDSHTQSSIASDGSPGQATADISLEVQVAPRTQLQSTKNNGISVDSSSSSQISTNATPAVIQNPVTKYNGKPVWKNNGKLFYRKKYRREEVQRMWFGENPLRVCDCTLLFSLRLGWDCPRHCFIGIQIFRLCEAS